MTETKPETDPPLTVVKLDVDAFKRLSAAHVEPSPTGLIPVRGRNGQGKSSLIQAIEAALGGKAAKVEEPIKSGEHGSSVVVDLGDLVVRRRWTRDSAGKAKTALTVEDADGNPQRSPQAVLDSLTGHFADPVAFLSMSAADQVRTVLGTMGLDAELDRLEGEAEGWYNRRRDLGRDADRLKKTAEVLSEELEGVDPEIGDILGTAAELTEELQSIEAEERDRIWLNSELEKVKHDGEAAARTIAELESKMAEWVAEKGRLAERWLELKGTRDKCGPVPDPKPIRERLRTIEERSAVSAKFDARAKAIAVSDAAATAYAEAHDALEDRRAQIAGMLGSATFPIEGMTYDPEAKVLGIRSFPPEVASMSDTDRQAWIVEHGLPVPIPFSGASQAERIRAAAAVAMSGNPRIRVVFIRDASLLDADSLAQIAQLADDSGFQVWAECVDSTREGSGIWIEDGEAEQTDGGTL